MFVVEAAASLNGGRATRSSISSLRLETRFYRTLNFVKLLKNSMNKPCLGCAYAARNQERRSLPQATTKYTKYAKKFRDLAQLHKETV
ncbi:MAG: hypothetical protein V7L07_04635 [Nostoc sp.]